MGKTEQKVFEFVERHHLIQNGDLLVAGISGGADSVSLFYLLKELQKKIDAERRKIVEKGKKKATVKWLVKSLLFSDTSSANFSIALINFGSCAS